jgi:hypothetical protein
MAVEEAATGATARAVPTMMSTAARAGFFIECSFWVVSFRNVSKFPDHATAAT